MPEPGQLINNKYRLKRLIGDGGMGSVYEATHEVLGTSVALKFLHSDLARRSGLVQRFLQEARVSARIQSPHVVRVTDVDQTADGLAFIVMEYLRGTSLQNLYEDLYRAGKRITYDEALEYAMQMMEGLEAAHAEGIVHRDLKPDNVMLVKGRRGEPVLKLLDFGIAKLKVTGEMAKGLTRPGVVMGTPEYMAPEQAFSADAVDARADIFSLGVIIFEMLAGRRPVGGDEAHQIAAQYLTGQISQLTDLAPHVPPELAAAVHQAMAANKENRFSNVAAFRAAIEPFADGTKPQKGRATPTPSPSNQPPPPTNVPDVSAAAAVAAPVAPVPTPGVARTVPPESALGAVSPSESSREPADSGRDSHRDDSRSEPHNIGFDATAEGIGEPSHPIVKPDGVGLDGGGTAEGMGLIDPGAAPVLAAADLAVGESLPGDATEERAPFISSEHAKLGADAKVGTSKTGTEVIDQAAIIAAVNGGTKPSPVASSLPGLPAGIDLNAPVLPSTQQAAPLDPSADLVPATNRDPGNGSAMAYQATASPDRPPPYDPNAFIAPAFHPGSTEPYEPPVRPGGTAVGEGFDIAAPVRSVTSATPAGTAVEARPGVDARVAPMHAPQHARKPAKSGGGLLMILMLAAGVAAAVTGGVYLANEYSSADEGDDIELTASKTKKKSKKKAEEPEPDPIPVVTPGPDPDPTEEPTPGTTATTPPPRPTTTVAQPNPTTTTPPPTSTTAPTTTTQPTSTGRPPIFTIPTGPVVIPSAFPTTLPTGINIPGITRPDPPPAPTPTTTDPGTSPPPPPPPRRPRIIIPTSTQSIPGMRRHHPFPT